MSPKIEFYVSEKKRKYVKDKINEHFNDKISEKIEKGIYDYTKYYCRSCPEYVNLSESIYTDHSGDILYNFNKNNKTFIKIKKLINNKEFNPYNIGFLTPDKLDEDRWNKILERKNTTEKILNNLPTIKWYKCKNCKNDKYTYRQEQTRSADEQMTSIYTCTQCNKSYKINN